MVRFIITRRLTIPAVATLIMLMVSSILFPTSIPLLAKQNQPLTGSSWSVVQSPNVGTSSNDLNGVAVVSSSNVWAVGEDNTNQALIEQWNGSSWKVVSSP